jgi:hypothetical protein
MARRDRVPLNAPLPQLTLKGWKIDRFIHVDMESGTMSGGLSFYDTSGRFVKSVLVADLPGGNDFQLTAAQVDQVAALFVSRAVARDPSLAGTRIVDVVTDGGDVVPNP